MITKKHLSVAALALILAPAASLLAEDMKAMPGMSAPAAASPSAKAAAPKAKKAKKARKAKAEAAKVWYTCSMHPEIHQDHPGKCPKCGMDLVKEAAAAKH